jgi:hypothetical protein
LIADSDISHWEHCIMNKSTNQRSEEARRQAQVALAEARRQQDEALKERASERALEIRKVESLRAQRLAHGDKMPDADLKPLAVKRGRLRTAA